MWIGSDIGGVCIVDIRDLSLSNPDRLKFVNIPSTGHRNGISSVNIRCIFQDSFGNMWIGNYIEGLDFISRTQPEFNILPYFKTSDNGIKAKPIWALHTDTDGKIWGGGEDEIVLFNDKNIERIYRLNDYLENSYGRVASLIRIGETILFSAFENGVMSLDISTGTLRRITGFEDRNYANTITEIPDGRVLLGMQDGIYEYIDGNLKKLVKLSDITFNLIPNGIVVDKQGKLWIGTYGDGIYIFDKFGNLKYHI